MYVTGSANTLADLVTAIYTACTDNGWSLATDVLYRGDVYVRVRVVGDTVEFLGGTGVDGTDALTGEGPASVRIRAFAEALSFPMTYEVHIFTDPDEVFVVVNYNVSFYQWAFWGQSSVEGLPGTGVWYTASQHSGSSTEIAINTVAAIANNRHCSLPFGPSSNQAGTGTSNNGFIQHGLDGETWNPAVVPPGPSSVLSALVTLPTSLIALLPNQWNDETALLPISVWRSRGSNKLSLVADLENARWCRIDFHDPGDIITIGDDSWKLYPLYRKDATNRNGGGTSTSGIQHTGTLGFAIRYTGD